MRTLGRHIKVDDTLPASVEEMKDGEIRVGVNGLFARVGDQILRSEWARTILYDDFEDGIVDPVWVWTYEKGGGERVEENGSLRITPVASGSGSRVFGQQLDIELISQDVWVMGEFYFDMWGKMTLPASPTGPFNTKLTLQFRDGVDAPKDQIAFYLTWNAGNFTYYLNFGDGASSGQESFIAGEPEGPGVNEVWWRFRFLPGDDKIQAFYSYKKSPHQIGWTDITSLMIYDPIPTGNITMDLEVRMQNIDPVNPQSAYWNEIADWVGEEITTTTTTSTTTSTTTTTTT